MTRHEAEELAERLRREHPDRVTHVWLVRQDADGWGVAKVARPSGDIGPVRTETERPKPSYPEDPRPWEWKNTPPS